MAPLTGRIGASPGTCVQEEVLEPQFRYDAQHLLPWFLTIERVLLVEYQRMGLLTTGQVHAIAAALGGITVESLTADPRANMSDLAFAIEVRVQAELLEPVPMWHVDRSRNDLQACAQLLFARDQLHRFSATVLEFGRCAAALARRTAGQPMPGYTHMQAAQVITPGFYLTAIAHEVLHSAERLLTDHDAMNHSVLGAGALAGQELPWDAGRMARLLGCADALPQALTCVASRSWALDCLSSLSNLGVVLSRFTTDLMAWGSSEYGFIELPDELSGISSAMPQKRNFPVLERIRGRSAHLSAFYLDLVLGQRNTPYTNMVEVSKEAGSYVLTAFDTARSTLRLFTTVLQQLQFREERMREACDGDYLGGFTLANQLTLRSGIPWRVAQTIAGEYIVARLADRRAPADIAPAVLADFAARRGYGVHHADEMLRDAFDVDRSLHVKQGPGSVRPDAVADALDRYDDRFDALERQWTSRRDAIRAAQTELDRLLGGSETKAKVE